MTKRILSITAALSVLFSLNSFAQTPEGCKGTKCTTEAQCKTDCKKQCKTDCKKQCKNPFQGLNLTADQQTKLAAIPSPRKVLETAKTDGTAKNVNPAEFVKNVRKDYLQQVKKVLTPEQYVQFLENNYINAKSQKAGKPGMKKGNKSHGQHAKGQREQRPMKK